MIADYTHSKHIFRHFRYTSAETDAIIKTLENGVFSYMPKRHEYGIVRPEKVNGIDVPTLWLSDNTVFDKTILLLAQDPLRSKKYWTLEGAPEVSEYERNDSVVIGTPYALHVTHNNIKRDLSLNVEIYRRLIETLITHVNCRVYCTDIFKYYPNDKSISTFDIKLLNEEIEIIRPDICICLGRFAQKAIERIGADMNYIHCPHPRAWPKSWDKWRKENEITSHEGYCVSSKVGNIITLLERKWNHMTPKLPY